MLRTSTMLRLVALSILSLALSGGAQAGYWMVEYDLAGSSLATTNPGGNYTDPITGTITIEYPAASSGAALDAGRLVAGTIEGTINQDAGIIIVTGENTNVLNPGLYPASGTLTGATLNLPVVANHTVTGYLHCAETTIPGICSATGVFTGIPASTDIPQSGSGTFPIPPLVFTGAPAGNGNFQGTGPVQTAGPGVTTQVTYVGSEVSRTWVASDLPVPVFGAAGTIAVLAGLLATGYGINRRRTA